MDEDRKPGNHQLLYYTIRSLINDDQVELNLRLTESRSQIMEQLQKSSLECCRNIYPSLTSLRLIRDMEQVLCLTSKTLTMEQLHRKWSMEDEFAVSDFSFLEPRLALRSTLLKQLSSVADDKELSDAFINTLLRMCREARQLANYQVANRCLIHLSALDLEPQFMFQCRLEKALTEWQRKNEDVALGILRSLVLSLGRETGSNAIYPQVLSLYGQWLAETRSENPRKILTQCFRKSVDVAVSMKSHEPGATVADARLMLAKYADSLYKDVVSYLESREFEAQQKLVRN